MLTAEAQVQTDRAARYQAQFCTHATGMAKSRAHGLLAHAAGGALAGNEVRLRAECTQSHGVVEFEPWGVCTMSVTGTGLFVRVEASNEANLRRIQEIVTNDLERFGKRDGLIVQWRPSELASDSQRQDVVAETTHTPLTGLRSHRVAITSIVGGFALVAVIGVHLVVAGAAVAIPGWLGWTAAGLIVIPGGFSLLHAAAPLTVIGLHQRLTARGRRASQADGGVANRSKDAGRAWWGQGRRSQ